MRERFGEHLIAPGQPAEACGRKRQIRARRDPRGDTLLPVQHRRDKAMPPAPAPAPPTRATTADPRQLPAATLTPPSHVPRLE